MYSLHSIQPLELVFRLQRLRGEHVKMMIETFLKADISEIGDFIEIFEISISRLS